MRIIDHFIAKQCFEQEDLLYKTRLLIGIVFAYLVVIFIFNVFFFAMPGMSMNERLAGMLPTSAIGLSFIGVLFLLKYRAALNLGANLCIAVTGAGVISGIYMTGGPYHTPSGAMLILPVFLAYCLLGSRGGFIWAGIILLLYSVGIVIANAGVTFPIVTKTEMLEIARAFNWYMAFFCLVSLIVIYETMSSRLRMERDNERGRYQRVIDVARETNVVAETAETLSYNGRELLDSALQQKTAIQQLSVTTEELGATAKQNSTMASAALQEIINAKQHIEQSDIGIRELMEAMQEVHRLSDEVKSMNAVINDIAYQTNLLSLNAMIEASRAGDENGGFKVVALEVKKLSERSTEAANNINALLETNKVAVDKGVRISSELQGSFAQINNTIEPISDSIGNVSNASYEQSEAIQQIVSGLTHISDAVEVNSDLAKNASDMSAALSQTSAELNSAIATLN